MAAEVKTVGGERRFSWNTTVTFHLLSVAQLSTHFVLFSGELLLYFYVLNYEV